MREDNISIEKIWQGDDFFEANVECSAKTIAASTRVYVSNEQFSIFYKLLESFLNNNAIQSVSWESGPKGNETTPCVVFVFSKLDLQGHICIEVFMELDDGGRLSDHTCCFFVNTETQSMYTFVQHLPLMLNNDNIGYRVSLHKSR